MLLIELHYLPCLEYFCEILAANEVLIEQHENYQKQTYRNRCRVLTANRVETLVVPVLRANSKVPIREMRIDNSQQWQRQHWGAISLAYAKAPFFEYYYDFFQPAYQNKYTHLFDFNWELLTICLKLMGVAPRIELTKWYDKTPHNDVMDARSVIKFPRSGNDSNFCLPKSYQQNFGVEFVENLSIIDLLFCQGPQAKQILAETTKL